MYDAVYSQNIGLCGFRCRVGACTRVVRTQRGITMHCLMVHGLRAQIALFDAAPISVGTKEKESGKVKTIKKPKLVRAAERAVLDANGEGLPFAGSREDS